MFKHVVSALALSGLLISGAAFAAEPGAATAATSAKAIHHGAVHKRPTKVAEKSTAGKTMEKATEKTPVKGKTEQSSQVPATTAPAPSQGSASAPAKAN